MEIYGLQNNSEEPTPGEVVFCNFEQKTLEEQLSEELERLFIDFQQNPNQPLPSYSVIDRIFEYTQNGEETEEKSVLEYVTRWIRFMIRSWNEDLKGAISDYNDLASSPACQEDIFQADFNSPDMSSFKGVFLLAKGEEMSGFAALIPHAQSGDPIARLLLKLNGVEWAGAASDPNPKKATSPWEAEQRIAEEAFIRGDYEKAILHCNEVLEHYPVEEDEDNSNVLCRVNCERDPAYETRAHCYLMTGRYAEALNEYEEMLKRGYPQAQDSSDYSMDPNYFWFGVTSILLGNPAPFQDLLNQYKEDRFWGERAFFYQLVSTILEKAGNEVH